MRSFSEYNSTPPEYKQADYGKSCLNCKYLDSQQNICRKYDASVSTNYVCLSWERGDPMNNLNESSKKHESVSETEVETLRMNLVTKYTPSQFYLFMTNNGDLKLDMIAFNKDKQKQGRGSALMHDLVQWADKKNLRIILTTGVRDPHWGTTSASRLKKFYKRFGFVENKGRNKDFTISGNMYRNPT